ncbi:hypothetical protein [Methylotenera mobilis]|uniref:hypothetical protein n=1 Tax=Methylotenera mobilis TaxID=359408 RepID=UPI00035CEC22|nr:hypothetical protein [Methylotenera mobilis]
MCSGVRYTEPSGKEWNVYFPNPKAALPVANSDGSVEWIKWGRRKEEQAPFVQGGWARSDSIELGKWERYSPVFVKLAVNSFMEKDAAKVSHWIKLREGTAIEALIVQSKEEKRIYIVTEATPIEYAWVHDRWPKINVIVQ